MSADPFLLHQGLGVQLQTFSLVEFAHVVKNFPEPVVRDDVAKVKSLGLPHKDTSDDDLPMASRLYLAMAAFLENENLDALAVRCWPEMPNVFGQWPYLGIARLADEGRAVVCEGDVDGALSAWIWRKPGHGKMLPLRLARARSGNHHPVAHRRRAHGTVAARHLNIQKPAVVEASIREDLPITILRFWHCDGSYHLTAREGFTLRPRRHLMGTNGLARLVQQDPREWFEELCNQGMPHHVAAFEGHWAGLLRRLARILRIHFV